LSEMIAPPTSPGGLSQGGSQMKGIRRQIQIVWLSVSRHLPRDRYGSPVGAVGFTMCRSICEALVSALFRTFQSKFLNC